VSPGCIFCGIVEGRIPSTVVLETPTTLAFRDINPQAPVHVVVIPKTHVDHLAALPDGDGAVLVDVFTTVRRAAEAEGLADVEGSGEPGYRVVVNVGARAGMSVPHLHVHVLGGRPLSWPPG
jgi:histidine triad (HIT) family protein